MHWLAGVIFTIVAVALTAGAFVAGGPILGTIVAVIMLVAYIAAYVRAYFIARATLNTPPLGNRPLPWAGTTNYIDSQGERNNRAFMIGMNAALTGGLTLGATALDPVMGVGLAIWNFVVVSLAAIPAVSTNRYYQGIIGWTGWTSPTSLLGSLVGFIVFVANLPFAIAIGAGSGNWWPVRFDWRTGVVELTGGFLHFISTPTAVGGTVGHFSFIIDTTLPPGTFWPTGPVPDSGPGSSPQAHEVGHCLDYVAFGFLRNILALVDQVMMGSGIGAYTEMTADSHVPHFGRFQVNMWTEIIP